MQMLYLRHIYMQIRQKQMLEFTFTLQQVQI